MSIKSNIGPFAMVPESLFRLVQEDSLNMVDVMVYIALSLRADRNTGECWPSQKTIGNEIGRSAETVRRSLNRLREIGVVDWEHRYEDEEEKIFSSNRYTVYYGLPNPRGGVPSSAGGGVTKPVREGVPSPAREKLESIINHNHLNQSTAPSGAAASTEISALDWDNSEESRAVVGKSIANRFYSWCRDQNLKRPAVKHKAFVNLIDDLIERGYGTDEIWSLLQAHMAGGFPWTLNSIAVTESRVRKEQQLEEFPDDWTEEDIAEYYAFKERRANGK